MIPSAMFFLKIDLAIYGLLCFHINLKIICPVSVENATGILIGIALNLQIALGSSMVILTILILLVQKHSLSFNLSYLQFLSSVS